MRNYQPSVCASSKAGFGDEDDAVMVDQRGLTIEVKDKIGSNTQKREYVECIHKTREFLIIIIIN